MPRAAPIRDKLDAYGVDQICEDICEGKMLIHIAEHIGVSRGSMLNWMMADPEREAQINRYRTMMARLWDEKAEEVLSEAKTQLELTKARELAQHYRWRASKTAPEYNDRHIFAGDPKAPLHGMSDEEVEAKIREKLEKAMADG